MRVDRLVWSLLALATAAYGGEFSDYRLPDHRVWTWDLVLDSRATSEDRFGTPDGNVSEGSSTARLFVPGMWLQDGDRARTLVTWNAAMEGACENSDLVNGSLLGSSRGRVTREDAAAWWEHQRYLQPFPFTWGLRLAAQSTFQQAWASNRLRGPAPGILDEQTSAVEHRDGQLVMAAPEFGVGRIRDVTPVADAWEIERRLARSGLITRPLSPGARRRLAQVVALEPSFASVRERPRPAVWDAIEDVLLEDGALRDDARHLAASLQALEPWLGRSGQRLPHSPVLRQRGVFAGAFLRSQRLWSHVRRERQAFRETDDSLGHSVVRTSSRASARAHPDFTEAGARVEFRYPVGARWQVDAASEAVRPIGHDLDRYSLLSMIDVHGLLAERWIARAGLAHSRQEDHRTFSTRYQYWRVSALAEVTVLVEDRWRVALSVRGDQGRWRQSSSTFTRTYYVSGAVSWRLSRRMSLYVPPERWSVGPRDD